MHVGYALDVARTAHKSAVEWIASFIWFVGQLHAAIFANVTVDVKVFIHGNYPNSLLSSLKEENLSEMCYCIAIVRDKRANSANTSTGVIPFPQDAHLGAKVLW